MTTRTPLEQITRFYSLGGKDEDVVEVTTPYGRDVFVHGGKRYKTESGARRFGGCADPAPIDGGRWIARNFYSRNGRANYHYEV